jgi:hypothetical protein
MENKNLSLFLPFLGLMILFSCGPQERVSKEVFEEVNKGMEVKRITEVEIIQEAMIWGDSITNAAQAELVGNLQKAIAEGGLTGAIGFCNENAISILERMDSIHSVKIRRVTLKPRNPSDLPDQEEFPIIEAYEYNAEKNIKSDPNIQKINEGEVFLYTKPISIPNAMCLSCHGEAGKEIDKLTMEKLSELYPNDQAKGYKIGDFRGMWSVRIPKKEVVKRF